MEVNLDIVKGKRMKEFMYHELEVALVAWFKQVLHILIFSLLYFLL